MNFLKIYAIFVLAFLLLMVLVNELSNYLGDKPKTNKIRQWWSRNIVDLDNKYDI